VLLHRDQRRTQAGCDQLHPVKGTVATMPLVDTLLETARQDTDLLIKNDGLGDNVSVPRPVDFLLVAREVKKAELVASFINDNRYGIAKVEQSGEEFRVLVVVEMPTTQNVLCAVSALMACIAELFSIEYDGWGCAIQKA
jgi:regulator of ribonuclease activity B